MIRRLTLSLALAALASAAQAGEAPRLLRFVAAAPTAPEPMPRSFVVDARIEDGDGPLQAKVDDGWFSGLGDPGIEGVKQDEIEGTCVEERCVLSTDLNGTKLVLTGDFAKAGGAATARFAIYDSDDKKLVEGPLTVTPFTDSAPGLGALAPDGAVTGAQLNELLLWSGLGGGFSNIYDAPPSGSDREALAGWQSGAGRPATGLLMAADLATLRADVDKQKRAIGWTEVKDAATGLAYAYPAALLRSLSASAGPGERGFASDDGKVALRVAAEPPKDGDAFDAFVDAETGDDKPHDGYTRVNDDFELESTVKGVKAAYAWHNGDKAFVGMALSYPEADEDPWGRYADLMQFYFRKANAEE